MDFYDSNQNNRININNDFNMNCNISKVLEIIKNKKDARWFCQENS